MVTGATTALGEVILRMVSGGESSPLMGGSPSGAMGGNGGANAQKEQVGVLQKIRDSAGKQAEGMKNQPRWWTKALKTMGIQMGIAGILKQSQIFTSTLGSLFQILGAFVDVMLAPWMPVIVPGLRKLANQIPNMRVAAQKFFDYVMALPWGTIGKVAGILLNTMKPTWWSGMLDKVLGGAYAWVLRQLSHIWNFLPGWMKGDTNPFDQQLLRMGEEAVYQTQAIKDGTESAKSWMEKIHLGIGGLAATWVAAKLSRYGLQATRWIPFVKNFTEPVRLMGKGIDRLFNKTAQILGKGFANLTKGLFNQLKGLFPKKPVVPKVPKGPRRLGRFGLGQADILDDIPGGGGRGGRGGGRGGGGGGRGGGRGDIDDAWKPKTRGSNIRAYGEGYDQIDWGKGEAGKQAGSFSDEVGGGALDKPGKESKVGKASKAYQKLKDWLGPNVKKITKSAAMGKMGQVKTTVGKGMSMIASALKVAAGTPFGRVIAKLAVGFLKILPFLGASYMGMETTYDLNKIRKSDKGWTGDMTSVSAWMTEGKGMLASLAGEGKIGSLTGLGPLSKGVRWLGSKGPGPVGDFFKGSTETLKRWKEAQGESGALSSGKALDFGIRAITGYGGAGASFLPLLGQVLGGAVYEGGKYTSMGQFMDMGFTGEAKYGEGSFAEASIDKIMQMFNGMTVNMAVDGASANAAFSGEI